MNLQRTFTFRNSKQTYTGIPIIAANMDTTGTFEMAQVLSKVSGQNDHCVCAFVLCGPANISFFASRLFDKDSQNKNQDGGGSLEKYINEQTCPRSS